MSKPSTVRLFVAIDPPGAVRAVLAHLPRKARGVAWTPPEQYHLTLRFIGEVEEERVAGIESALRAVRVEPFLLGVEGVGTFPPLPRPPKVIWVGIGSAHPRLFQLRQKIDDTLLALGLDLDVRTFEPHFTLGRVLKLPQNRRNSKSSRTRRPIGERAEALSQLGNAVHDDLEPVASRFGKKRGPRRYQKPHDTRVARLSMPCEDSFFVQTGKAVISKHALGRCGPESSAGEIKRLVRDCEGFAGPTFRVDAFALYRSDLRPSGAVHTPLLQVALEGGAK